MRELFVNWYEVEKHCFSRRLVTNRLKGDETYRVLQRILAYKKAIEFKIVSLSDQATLSKVIENNYRIFEFC